VADTLIIDPRYCGPRSLGHGGYFAGLLAPAISNTTEVTLRSPIPVGAPINVSSSETGVTAYTLAGTLIAETVGVEAALTPCPTVSLPSARLSEARSHELPHHNVECFACGRRRPSHDGLGLTPGETGAGIVACTWTPKIEFSATTDFVSPEFAWAALDCPGAYALPTPNMVMLGRITASLCGRIRLLEPHVVCARLSKQLGPRFFTDSAIYTASGELRAMAHSIWFEVSPERWSDMLASA